MVAAWLVIGSGRAISSPLLEAPPLSGAPPLSKAPPHSQAPRSAETPSPETRRIAFDYVVTLPASSGEAPAEETVQLFLPIAQDGPGQKILALSIDSPFAGGFEREADFGNRFWRAQIPARRSETARISVRYEVERSVVRAGDEVGSAREARRFLAPSERVPVGAPILDPILAEIRAASPDAAPSARARAIYDWIVENVEYKKVGTGWGNGDTFWACNARYGNCTDFHSLFLSLARTERIPARFEMGFPIPTDRGAGRIAGYHCWLEFWLPETGWVPVDASEAFKRPEARELFYGTQPADRIQFTRGRDLRLGEAHRGRPLNYFIYPYAEAMGEPVDLSLQTEFRYRDLIGAADVGGEGEAATGEPVERAKPSAQRRRRADQKIAASR